MADEKDAKPKVEDATANADQINLKVKDVDGNEVNFKIKRTTQLQKLMKAYSERLGANIQTYRFMFDGKRVENDDTPEKLDMDEGDCIDAMVYQQGGAGYILKVRQSQV
uniref:Ubiquitin-like domain-containing protein n=1 Tax=Erythrolobus madagascarensis TaxID=708628 RepID=A0A7S0T4E4_9RHOD|mmetsp:Transcript_2496/g.5592  ORF Transcript_2496/g.5592 Transcript_2496/m.5592 type:complete len:109 (+) Transcript_2496:77-403(+)|eukprot:CAMPEP_0185848520 /NCGR_PEP_ID=MMETSP1354-20130828/3365_1 /TAXON_ID=708628 /ORGANISM="Erythrolobus madagascarensis, Strain CCMP3276" /LENGTH=108 /DNA_ID=CAMNT_0028548925 /DNA_START=77 /DNA_END=403 /DNA_ORIENTATION=-